MLFLQIYNNTVFSIAQQPENRGQDGIRYFILYIDERNDASDKTSALFLRNSNRSLK